MKEEEESKSCNGVDRVPSRTGVTEEGGSGLEAKAIARPVRDPLTKRWLPGCPSPNPAGKPRGGGRVGCLRLLDELLNENETQEKLTAALRKMLDSDPIGFWRSIIQPLLPKEVGLTIGSAGDVTVAVAAVRAALGMGGDR